MNNQRALVGVILFGAIVAAGGVARADFSFSTTSGGSIPFDGAGNMLVLTGQPASQILNFMNGINIQDVEISSPTPSPNLINVTVPFSFTLSVVQTSGLMPSMPGTGSITVTGSLSITRADTGGELSTLASLSAPTFTIGNTQYAFSRPPTRSRP